MGLDIYFYASEKRGADGTDTGKLSDAGCQR
ncbi:hypothetical protein HmCmsJML240_05008 [Escherichia coli]|nr:hypothetical protein HmCmsJML240_05008 [Escherichia coli]